MSQIFKFNVAVALAVSAIVGSASAESDSVALSAANLASEMDGANSASMSNMIEARIRGLMAEMGEPIPKRSTGNLTIEEIDKVNRMAERERTELQFEQTKFQRMELEIERLMALYDAAKTLDGDRKKAASERRSELASTMDSTPDPNMQRSESFQSDMEDLPHIESITGIMGKFTAEAQFDGQFPHTLQPNSVTPKGFTVKEILSTHVLLEGPQSGQVFRLVPQSKHLPPEPTGGPGGNIDAIDLSQFPMATF